MFSAGSIGPTGVMLALQGCATKPTRPPASGAAVVEPSSGARLLPRARQLAEVDDSDEACVDCAQGLKSVMTVLRADATRTRCVNLVRRPHLPAPKKVLVWPKIQLHVSRQTSAACFALLIRFSEHASMKNGLFVGPNVRVNPARGGRCCKAGRRRWYTLALPGLTAPAVAGQG